jgi:hypothetical protein
VVDAGDRPTQPRLRRREPLDRQHGDPARVLHSQIVPPSLAAGRAGQA